MKNYEEDEDSSCDSKKSESLNADLISPKIKNIK